MLKKTLFVLLSVLILSGVCFAQEDSAKKQMEETTSAVAPVSYTHLTLPTTPYV